MDEKKLNLTQEDLVKILTDRNKVLKSTIIKRDKGELADQSLLTHQTAEALLLIKLIHYIDGKIKLEDI